MKADLDTVRADASPAKLDPVGLDRDRPGFSSGDAVREDDTPALDLDRADHQVDVARVARGEGRCNNSTGFRVVRVTFDHHRVGVDRDAAGVARRAAPGARIELATAKVEEACRDIDHPGSTLCSGADQDGCEVGGQVYGGRLALTPPPFENQLFGSADTVDSADTDGSSSGDTIDAAALDDRSVPEVDGSRVDLDRAGLPG
jgi:hypothetical protein